MRARASPLTSIASSWPTWYTSSRACHFGAARARMSLGAVSAFMRPRGDAAAVALLADDAEVAELERAAVADEHVQRREVAVQHLPAMELAEHLEDARDLAPRGRFRPPLAVALRGTR